MASGENNDFFIINKSEVDAKADQEGFDSLGRHNCTDQYQDTRPPRTNRHRTGSTVEKVLLKCATGIDLADFYPSAVKFSWEDIIPELAGPDWNVIGE